MLYDCCDVSGPITNNLIIINLPPSPFHQVVGVAREGGGDGTCPPLPYQPPPIILPPVSTWQNTSTHPAILWLFPKSFSL